MASKVFGFVLAGLFVLSLLASAAFAAGPEWSGGFPKLSQKNALLQWAPVKGAEEYKVYKGEAKGSLKVIATVKVNRYIDKGLAPGKTFFYAVSAVSGGKEGVRSTEGKVSTAVEKAFVPLKVPKLVGLHLKEQPGGKSSIGLRWEGAAGTDLVGVNVYRSKTKGKGYALIGSSQTDTYEDSDVQAGVTYYYVVAAVDNQFNETGYSNEMSEAVPAPASAKAAEEKAAQKAPPTMMRPGKLLFRIPREDNAKPDQYIPENAQAVAVDEAVGHIYVASYGYGGILVYDMEGRLQFGIRRDGVDGTQRFTAPQSVAVGPNGNIYVTCLEPDVYVFSFSGKPVDKLTVGKEFMPNFKNFPPNPFWVVIKDDKVYFTDPNMNGYHVFRLQGFKNLQNVYAPRNAEDKKNAVYYNGPSTMVVTDDGEVVFLDSGFSRLVVYGSDGKFRRYISKPGVNAGEISYPFGMALGNKGEIIVANALDPNIQAFGKDGKFLYALSNEKVDGPLSVRSTHGMCIDSKNRFYVSEGLANRVSVFQLEDKTVEMVPK